MSDEWTDHSICEVRQESVRPRIGDRSTPRVPRLIGDGGLPGRTPTRQVLVVGDGIPGLALTMFLEADGYEPVLVSTPTDHPATAVTTIGVAALELLDRCGVGDAIRDATTPLSTVGISTTDEDSPREITAEARGGRPCVGATSRLEAVLRSHLDSDAMQISTPVTTIRDRGRVLEVEFRNGVREPFDLVVGTDGPTSTVRTALDESMPSWRRCKQMEFLIHDARSPQAPIIDSWAGPGLGQYITAANTDIGDVLRVTTDPEIEDHQVLIKGLLPESTPDDTDLEANRVDYLRHAGWEDGVWRTGRVAFCGSSAFPVLPATGLQTTLAIEDAWVLVDALQKRSQSTLSVLDEYERRRRHRIETMRRRSTGTATHHDYPVPDTDPWRTVAHRRTIAIGVFCVGAMAELQQAIPNRL